MARVDSKSGDCLYSSLDIFSVPPTQIGVDKRKIVCHQPISSLGSANTIEFVINTGSGEFLDLSSALLYTKNRILKRDGTAFIMGGTQEAPESPGGSKVAPINYFGNTRFKSLELYINGVLVTPQDSLYPYRAMFEILLSRTPQELKNQYSAGLYFKEKAGRHDQVMSSFNNAATASTLGNPSTFSRYERCRLSKVFESISPLHIDLAQQDRLFCLDQCEIKVVLRLADAKFSLISQHPEQEQKIEIQEASLWIDHLTVNEHVLEAQRVALQHGPAKIPYTKKEMRFFSYGAGRSDIAIPNLHSGQKPKRVFVAMVENDSFVGSSTKSPFNFKSFNNTSATLRFNGESAYFETLCMKPDSKEVLLAYVSLLKALGKDFKGDAVAFDYEDYATEGFHILGFSLSSSDDLACCCYDRIESGSLSLELAMSEALPSAVTVIVLFEFSELAEIDETKTVRI